MNIVVLDGYTLNPGDLSWSELEKLGKTTIYDRTPTDQVVQRAAPADIVLTNKTLVQREHIEALPNLRYVGVLATGYNIVDIATARARHVPVTNVPAYGTRSVAQMTFALLLELTQHAGHHSKTVRDGRWNQSPDFCYWDYPLIELDQLTMGIVGLGQIGRAVAHLAAAFGMRVLAHTRSPSSALPDSVQRVELEQLFRRSDVLTLHCPLTPETKHLVNRQRLGWMKPSAFLLNTSRGGLVDEQALADALNDGKLAGAGLDVLSVEPPPAHNPLLQARNCIVTPHIAWASRAARARLLSTAIANVQAFLSGQLKNVVNL